jgi:ATP-dependent Clp protease protease subunit
MSTKISSEWIDALLDHGIDRKNRRIFFFDDVDDKPIGVVIKSLYLMDSENSDKPIELFVSSYGGSEYDMFGLYDAIQTIKSPVYTIAIGKCMSAAPLLVACGTKGHRYSTPNTWFMVHAGSVGFEDKKYNELKNDMAHFDEMGERWYKLMAENTSKPASFWESQCKMTGDKYFTPDKAIEWGLIDQIWSEK